MCEIIPGILEKDWEPIERKIELVKPFAKTIHIDIIDGKFASNTTFLDPKPFVKYTKDIFFELHMMVDDPIQYLKPWAEVGFRRFLGHVEKIPKQTEFVAEGQLLGEVGLVVDALTSIDQIKVPLDDLDAILIMTVKAGLSGQTFLPESLEKVRLLKPKTWIPIEVDGGINSTTFLKSKKSGATRFVTTSSIFNSDNPFDQYKKLEKLIKT